MLREAGMPGLHGGMLAVALLSIRLRHGRPAPTDPALDWGPYETWTRPLRDIARGDVEPAAHELPDPPADHLQEVIWCVMAEIAIALSERDLARRVRRALGNAAGELAGAGSGLITLGPISETLARLEPLCG
jgi:hypothetical protein